MQIQFVITAAISVACLCSMSPAIAAHDEQITSQETNVEPDSINNVVEPQTKPEEMAMNKEEQTNVAVRLRVGQSRDNHRDARVCLNETSNTAIIKCAEKYRYLTTSSN